MKRNTKTRLDVLLLKRGLAESREQAQRLVQAGMVLSGMKVLSKPGQMFPDDIPLEIKEKMKFVSRGGDKLEFALKRFKINLQGLICLDVGASTGGFTDCMLQYGAKRVIAVDVGYGQLHWKLRIDKRVTVLEKLNARYLKLEDLPAQPEFSAIDVSFISLTKVMPSVVNVLVEGASLVTLVKPQFEVGREYVEKGGVVRDEKTRQSAVDSIVKFGTSKLDLKIVGIVESPLRGPAGNIEYLLCWQKCQMREIMDDYQN